MSTFVLLAVHALVAADVEPRTITLAPASRPVAEILDAIEKQTGNRVLDRRSASAPAKIDVGFDKQTFWQALDRLATKLDARVSLYHDDGIRLVDGPARGEPVDAGICRVEIKSLAVQRDLETKSRTCVVQLEIAWEPSYEPLWLTVDKVRGTFAADAKGHEAKFDLRQGVAQQVTQRRAQLVELRIPAPDRSSPAIASLKGDLKFVGPTKMLTATFAKLTPGGEQVYVEPNTDDPAKVTLKGVKANAAAWSFDLAIVNPKKNPPVESFQEATWIENNRIHLERTRNGVKEVWLPNLNERQETVHLGGAEVKYHFTDAKGKGPIAEWTLVYRTPSRIVPTIVPFEFRNVALP